MVIAPDYNPVLVGHDRRWETQVSHNGCHDFVGGQGRMEDGGRRGSDYTSVSRRSMLWLTSAGTVATLTGWPNKSAASELPLPLLATPDQIAAERTLRQLLAEPMLKRVQADIRAELTTTSRARLGDAAATLDNAVAQWTNSLIFAELLNSFGHPVVLWATDDTPRSWLGYTLGGVGTSGDNPDGIYRSIAVDGSGEYEIIGQFDLQQRPAQIVFEVFAGDMTKPGQIASKGSRSNDWSSLVSVTDRELTIAADGGFRITLGGQGSGPNHFPLPPGGATGGFRDMLSDWNQKPSRLAIRQIGGPVQRQLPYRKLVENLCADLAGYIRHWAHFPDIWFGGLSSNTISGPSRRNGNWGSMAGLRYSLASDEALVVTTIRGRAAYTGFQITDPWMITPDGRRHNTSVNTAQAVANFDSTFTYVISPTDPGVANWLDTGGLKEGFGIIRWQGLAPDTKDADLLSGMRRVKLSDIPELPGLTRVSPQQRATQLAERATAYASRTQ